MASILLKTPPVVEQQRNRTVEHQQDQQTPYFERQYNNRLSIPDAAAFNTRGERQSQIARRDLDGLLDVAYGRSARERIDIFHGRGDAPRPLLVFIHGGYWRSRDKSEFSFVAPPFVAAGFTVALPTYDLTPNVTVEHIIGQMRAAHAWLYRNAPQLGIDRSRIFVAGHSAGAHLAAMMLVTSWPQYASDVPVDLIKGVYAISGIYDLKPMLQFSFNADIRLDAESARRASPLTYLPSHAVPLYTAVGADESDEFKRQAQEIRDAWPECRAGHLEVPCSHHLSILEALADGNSELFHSVLRMMQHAPSPTVPD